jgi:hypothetical protein
MRSDSCGRPYARLSKLRAGMLVQVDGDFACEGVQEIEPWAVLEVKAFPDGELYIDCVHKGEVAPHPLEIQGDFSDDEDDADLVGVYMVEFGFDLAAWCEAVLAKRGQP